MKAQNTILLLEPEAEIAGQIHRTLEDDGHRVVRAQSGEEALALLAKSGFHLIISALNPDGGLDGLALLEQVNETAPHTPVIIISSGGAVQKAVEAMRAGAFDFQQTPLDLSHLSLTVVRALDQAALKHAYDYLRHEQPYIYRLENILAESPPMRRILEQVSRVAPTDVTVLLTGETGTGKSMIAGAIHANSVRREGALVTVNCAALSETLLESELFGHEKGAFTGAHKARAGRFQQAHGGTLFLDEVGDMSLTTQAETLRAIEDKIVQPLGSARQIQVDVRIIAATNRDLAAGVEDGRFRGDLFYRLNVATLHIPPLRERVEDIPPLAEMFRRKMTAELNRPHLVFSTETVAALTAYHWPGNIRELRNTVERAVLFAGGREITPVDLGLKPVAAPPCRPAASGGLVDEEDLDLKTLEERAIKLALERTDGVQKDAAQLLGISARALSYKLDKMGLSKAARKAAGGV